MTEEQKKLLKMNTAFYDLIYDLKEEKFEFCAYLVEEAYRFFVIALESCLK